MYSRAKLFGHPIHPMLIPFPITFYTTTLVAFAVYGLYGDPFWFRVGYAANIAGVVMALVAAAFGLVDFTAIPDGTAAKKHGYQHMALNVTSVAIFAINILFNAGQWNATTPEMTGAIVLPLLGLLATLGAGYLGWTLVQTHHVGVHLTPTEEQMEERRRRAA